MEVIITPNAFPNYRRGDWHLFTKSKWRDRLEFLRVFIKDKNPCSLPLAFPCLLPVYLVEGSIERASCLVLKKGWFFAATPCFDFCLVLLFLISFFCFFSNFVPKLPRSRLRSFIVFFILVPLSKCQ